MFGLSDPTTHYFFQRSLRKVSDRSYLEELAERFQLELDRKFQDLSHGNKQKVGLIQAFMHRPKLLILDEPTASVDDISEEAITASLEREANAGRIILVASHRPTTIATAEYTIKVRAR